MSDPTTLSAPAHDTSALARFDVFLFSAVATVLVVRAALAVTGYPQVGGNGLHIAHVLWGGLLMAVAIILVQVFPGSRMQLRAAFAGGIGFGLFIDEVGKFVTKDVDYFFQPAVAIMYATFVALYLLVRLMVRQHRLTDRRRLAIATQALADLALGQLDAAARDRALAMVAGVDPAGPFAATAASLRDALMFHEPAQPGVEARITAVINWFQRRIVAALSSTAVLRLVVGWFVVQAASVVLSVTMAVVEPDETTRLHAVLDTGISSLLSGMLVVSGVASLLLRHRRRGLDMLEWALMINLLFTQVAVFNREEWLGLVGFGISLAALGTVRLAQTRQAFADSIPATGERAGAPRAG